MPHRITREQPQWVKDKISESMRKYHSNKTEKDKQNTRFRQSKSMREYWASIGNHDTNNANKQWKRIPFDMELAMKIQSGEVEGRIIVNEFADYVIELPEEEPKYDSFNKKLHDTAEVLATPKYEFKVGDIVTYGNSKEKFELVKIDNSLPTNIWVEITAFDGRCTIKCPMSEIKPYEEKHDFKPFDKVLVRNKNNRWYPRFYAETDGLLYYTTDSKNWEECIPYEGNEHLVGTTNNPE